jgi:hypothetical protein
MSTTLLADIGNPTTLAAWWGAVLASVAFLWDAYKWWTTGPQIRMVVLPERRVVGDPELEGKTLIAIQATNVGDRPTTLENLAFVWYANWWNRLRWKQKRGYIIINPGRGRNFPYKLEVGERWDGLAFQEETLVQEASTGHLMVELSYASSKRPIRKRLQYAGLKRFAADSHAAS